MPKPKGNEKERQREFEVSIRVGQCRTHLIQTQVMLLLVLI